MLRHTCVLMAIVALTGCGFDLLNPPIGEAPKISKDTPSAQLLKDLPPAKDRTVVSVYAFEDQTGQLKPNDNFANYSRAVTQGGLALVNKALLKAGNGSWFTVIERGGLQNLLQERQIIEMTRNKYATENEAPAPLPPLLYAGMLIEGGVVGYDSNIITGGAGANYLGVGGDIKYRRDIVTVDLRAISVANGQVLLSVTSEKTIYSTALTGSIFKYVAFNHLLQAETGYTLNEPPQLAVRQAIETAVYSLIMEGTRLELWTFADPLAGNRAMVEYMRTVGKGTEEAFTLPPENYKPIENLSPDAQLLDDGTPGNYQTAPTVKSGNVNVPSVPLNPARYPVMPLPPPTKF